MKIVVNSGRTVHVAAKPGTRGADGSTVRPVVKAFGPTHLIDVSDEDAKSLIARGAAKKYEDPKPVEVAKVTESEKTENPKK